MHSDAVKEVLEKVAALSPEDKMALMEAMKEQGGDMDGESRENLEDAGFTGAL